MRLRIGVVGLNHGVVLARAVAACGALELAGLCTRNPARHQAHTDRFCVPVFTHLESLLTEIDLDGVIIAAPIDQLASMARQCLQRDISVLIEKPAGVSVSEVLSIADVAARSTARVVVGYYRRLAHQVVALRELLAAQVIGDIQGVSCKLVVKKPPGYFQGWKASRQRGGGCLMINLIHDLDLLQELLGPVETVSALQSPSVRADSLEHFGVLGLSFRSGAVGTVIFSDESPSAYSYDTTVAAISKFPRYPVDSHHFFGTRGSLAFPSFTLFSSRSAGSSWYDELSSSIASDANETIDDPITLQVERFAQTLSGSEEPHATLEDAMRNLAVVEAIRRSLECSSIERVHYPPECAPRQSYAE